MIPSLSIDNLKMRAVSVGDTSVTPPVNMRSVASELIDILARVLKCSGIGCSEVELIDFADAIVISLSTVVVVVSQFCEKRIWWRCINIFMPLLGMRGGIT